MINRYRKQWGGVLLVSLLALSLVLAGCSEPAVMGSDISGTWTYTITAEGRDVTLVTCNFNSDGTCSATIRVMSMEVEGTWSLNGSTVAIDASGSFDGEDCTMTLTCTYNNSDTDPTLKPKSGTVTMTTESGTVTMDITEYLSFITLTRE